MEMEIMVVGVVCGVWRERARPLSQGAQPSGVQCFVCGLLYTYVFSFVWTCGRQWWVCSVDCLPHCSWPSTTALPVVLSPFSKIGQKPHLFVNAGAPFWEGASPPTPSPHTHGGSRTCGARMGYFEKMARGWSKHAHGVSSATSGCCCCETSLWHALSMFHTVSRRCRGWGGENPLRSKLLEPRASWRELGCWARQGRHAALLFFAKGLRAHVDREVNSGFGLLLAPWPTIFLGLLRAASAWISTRRF